MLYEIESDFLSADSRQMLAKILAEHFAGIADTREREAQAALRSLADARPAPDEHLRAAVEADKTPYVPGVRGKRRTVAVVPTASPSEPPKTEAKPLNEPLPLQQEVKNGFFTRLLAWFKDCPIRRLGVPHHPFGLD